jgi:Cd2+/Zn2+-exporting ATPase
MGYTGLWEAVVFDVGTALAVILNGMTVLKAGPEEKAAMAPEGGVKTAHSHAPSHAHSHGGKQCAGDHFKTEAAAKKALGVGVRSAASGDALELAEQGAGGAPAPVHGHGHSHAAAAKDKQVSSHNNLSKPPPPPPAQALVKKDSCQTKKC